MDAAAPQALPDLEAESAAQRANRYGILAEVYRAEPRAGLLRELAKPALVRALAGAGARDLGLSERPDNGLTDDLAVEYARLFAGPGPHVSPCASVHLEGEGALLWGPTTVWARRFMEGAGFAHRTKPNVPPDHLSTELGFIQRPAAEAAERHRAGDGAEAERLKALQAKFMGDHRLRWVPAFCEQAIAAARLPFYRAMAGLTADFIRSERETAGSPVH